jgi:outer membrane protein OmpA-like peptidoglycan-associated protein
MHIRGRKQKTENQSTYASPRPHPPTSLAENSAVDSLLRLQQMVGNQAVQQLLQASASVNLQPKFKVSAPGDSYEQEADRVADQVLQMPDEEVERKQDVAVSGPARIERSAAGSSSGGGQPLSDSVRSYFEPRFGEDFSQVRLHTDERAAQSAQGLGASAYTLGQDVVLGEGQYAPETVEGRQLLAHELAHVVQQSKGESDNMIQRRLIATGTWAGIQSFLSLARPASGLQLVHDPATHQITANASIRAPHVSPTFQRILTDIMDDPVNHAEVNFGSHQTAPTPGGGPATGVAIGLFPMPHDFTGSHVQLIDMDDILAVEAGAPGNGVADLAHELEENYRAHLMIPIPGVDLFEPAHRLATMAESQVASELVGPGELVAQVIYQTGTIIYQTVDDFDNYYLVSKLTQDPTTRDVTVSNVHRAPKETVSNRTIDHFLTDSDVVPGTGGATLAQVVADLTTHEDATVLIEGFTDDTGDSAYNDDLSDRRAENARAALAARGINPDRVHIVGQGETNFIAPNDTEAHRALNRRVVITVTRPHS